MTDYNRCEGTTKAGTRCQHMLRAARLRCRSHRDQSYLEVAARREQALERLAELDARINAKELDLANTETRLGDDLTRLRLQVHCYKLKERLRDMADQIASRVIGLTGATIRRWGADRETHCTAITDASYQHGMVFMNLLLVSRDTGDAVGQIAVHVTPCRLAFACEVPESDLKTVFHEATVTEETSANSYDETLGEAMAAYNVIGEGGPP